MKRLLALVCIAAFAATFLAPASSLARRRRPVVYWYEYSVPFTCAHCGGALTFLREIAPIHLMRGPPRRRARTAA